MRVLGCGKAGISVYINKTFNGHQNIALNNRETGPICVDLKLVVVQEEYTLVLRAKS